VSERADFLVHNNHRRSLMMLHALMTSASYFIRVQLELIRCTARAIADRF
jgi:hypothetical protein